jgi:hypothetical protein
MEITMQTPGIIAHVGGVPVEEILPAIVGGMGAGLLLARAWVVSRVRHGSRSRGRAREDSNPRPAD